MSTIYRIEGDMLCEQPTMEKPECYRNDDTDMDCGECRPYYLRLASLKKYSLGSGWLQEDRNRDITESEFEVKYQMNDFENTDDEKKWINCTHHQYNKRGTMSRRIVANKLPVQNMPAEEGSARHEEDDTDDVAGTFHFDHEKQEETYTPNPNFGKPKQSKSKVEKINTDYFPFFKTFGGKWFYCFKDMEGRNQHSKLFDKREDADTDYNTLRCVRESELSNPSPKEEQAAKVYSEKIIPQTNLRNDSITTSRDAIREDVYDAFIAGWQSKEAPSAQPSDAVEFAEWASINKYIYYPDEKIWMLAYDDGIHDQWTTEQLYKLFKQQP